MTRFDLGAYRDRLLRHVLPRHEALGPLAFAYVQGALVSGYTDETSVCGGHSPAATPARTSSSSWACASAARARVAIAGTKGASVCASFKTRQAAGTARTRRPVVVSAKRSRQRGEERSCGASAARAEQERPGHHPGDSVCWAVSV